MANIFTMHAAMAFAVCAVHAYGVNGIDEGTCSTARTISPTVGMNLIQAVSLRERLIREFGGPNVIPKAQDEEMAHQIGDSPSTQYHAHVEHMGNAEKAKAHDSNETFNVQAVISVASSLIQQGSMVRSVEGARSVMSRMRCWCTECLATVSTHLESMSSGATFWSFGVAILLLLMGIAVYVLIYHPAVFGGSGTRERSFYPLRASPQMSNRNLKSPLQTSSPMQTSAFQPSPGRGTLMSRGTANSLPKRMTTAGPSGSSSEDDEPSRFGGGIPSEAQFCPDLVVPQQCECILVLPLDHAQLSMTFEVSDTNGTPVLRVVPQQPTAGRLWRATLTSTTGDLLAQCCEASSLRSNTSEIEYQLMRTGGQLWAKLVYDPARDRYALNPLSGGVLHLWGTFPAQVHITDDSNRLFATTEIGSSDFDPQGKYCKLRVAPLADVGLALCGLLCIGHHANIRNTTSM
jgi:hypothetical protein